MAEAKIKQAFLMLLDGIDVAFWSDEDARDALSSLLPHTTHHPGLRIPTTTLSVDLKQGQLSAGAASFTIDDVDDTLAALFAAVRSNGYDLTSTLQPTDTDATLENTHIGTERLGEDGVRRRFAALPGEGTYGDFHPSRQITDPLGQRAVPVDDGAALFAGRRCALYRLTRGRHETWAEAVTESDLRSTTYLKWWGTLRDQGSVKARTWTIRADGPQSLLRRQLNVSSFQDGRTVESTLRLRDEEKWVGGAVGVLANNSTSTGFFRYGEVAPSQISFSSDTSAGVATAVSGIIDDVGNASGDSGFFQSDSDGNGFVKMIDTGSKFGQVIVRLKGESGSDYAATYTDAVATLRVVAHEKCWRALGYEPQTASNWPNSDGRRVVFTRVTQFLSTALPSGDYWLAIFDSWPRNIERDGETPFSAGIGLANTRRHEPQAGISAGVHVMDSQLDEGQEITIGGGFDPDVPIIPSLDAPPASSDGSPSTTAYQLSSTDVSAQRALLFYGPFRALSEDEERDIGQIGRCSWVESPDGIVSQSQVVLTHWHDPRLYGVRNGKLEGDWAANVDAETGIRVLPLAHLGFAPDGYDNRGDVALALMLGSGTSTGWWTTTSHSTRAYGMGGGVIAPGLNNLASTQSLGTFVLDRVGVDLALNIPRDLVAPRSTWETLVGELPPDLAGVKVAWAGPQRGDEVLQKLMAPVGWALTLRDGKYTPMVPSRVWSPSDADITLTPEDLVGGKDGRPEIPTQGLRHRAAIDEVMFQWRWDPLRAEHWYEYALRATDPGARYRSGAAKHQVDASWERFDFGPGRPAVRNLWDRIFRWWAQRHFEVRGLRVLQHGLGENIWPGTVVRLTDPWLVDQNGSYGVTGAVGIVVSAKQRWDKAETEIDLLVQTPPRDGYHVHAPEARMLKWDSSTSTGTFTTDFRGIGNGHNDLALFEQPSWSASAAAGASVKLLQFVRGSLYQTLTNTISIVDSSAGTIVFTGAWSGGTFYRDMDSILVMREFANQSADWVKEVFAPIADEDGEVGGSTTDAVRFNDA